MLFKKHEPSRDASDILLRCNFPPVLFRPGNYSKRWNSVLGRNTFLHDLFKLKLIFGILQIFTFGASLIIDWLKCFKKVLIFTTSFLMLLQFWWLSYIDRKAAILSANLNTSN